LPTLWFRNTWSWDDRVPKPMLATMNAGPGITAAQATHHELGDWVLCADASTTLLFCENETNNERLFGVANASPYVKDAIDDYLVHGCADAVNPQQHGTKVAAHHVVAVAPQSSASLRLRLSALHDETAPTEDRLGVAFTQVLQMRRDEADEFYASVIPPTLQADRARVMRQALAGMLWGKQYYEYHVRVWLREHGVDPWNPNAPASSVRNRQWSHMVAGDVISMPDKWEYPWFAAWDLAFQCVPLALVDIDFAKEQVELLLKTRYLHPNGQVPAYEWNFDDVNPPVTAWAALQVYEYETVIRGEADREFLARVFHRLLTNFTWWVNRKDPAGRNLFQGGFLGLDNIGVFDRSATLPGGITLEQADGTAWMALYCQSMLQIAIELARHDASYRDMAIKFFSHFAWIAIAMNPPDGDTPLWDEQDGFYYDVIRMPDGSTARITVRSLVGLLPLCAATVFEPDMIERNALLLGLLAQTDRAVARIGSYVFPDSAHALAHLPKLSPEGRGLVSLVDETRLRRLLAVMLDEQEFLGPHGIRSISRRHLAAPCVFDWQGRHYSVGYLPAESDSFMFGGNSNWRGPVWFPINLVIVRALAQLHRYYGDRLKVKCPTGSGPEMNLLEVAIEISRRLASTFVNDDRGRRPVFGASEKFQTDPHWHDLPAFHEYFDGDTGCGIGASHQTGWTGIVALLLLFTDGLRSPWAPGTAAVG